MKFNYKKVASVLASAIMLSSTIGFAAAAKYPSPFTEGAAVIYGTNAASTDMAAAINIYDQLKARTSGNVEASVSGDAKAVETGSQPLYLSDHLNSTKATLTKDDLRTVLASGKMSDDDGKEISYDLKLNVPNNAIKYGETADTLSAPVIYLDTDSSTTYTERIVFPTAVNLTKLTDESITLFGKQYVFTGNTADLISTTGSAAKIVLFEKSTPVIVNDGESKTVEGHTISVAVEDTSSASVTIDGVTEKVTESNSKKIGGIEIYLKNVVGPNVAGTSRYAEIYLNSNKVTLQNGTQVTVGSTDVQGTVVTFTIASGKATEIAIAVTPYSFEKSIKYIKQGDSLTDPVFKSLKFTLSSLTPELTSDARDYILIKPSGEQKAELKFTNKAGKTYDLNLIGVSDIRLNETYGACGGAPDAADKCNGTASSGGTYTYNATTLKYDGTKKLITTTTGVANVSDAFITCNTNGEYSQIWEVQNIVNSTTSSYVTLLDKGSGSSSNQYSLDSSGAGTLTLADGSTATLQLQIGALGITSTKTCTNLMTKKGARIILGTANGGADNSSVIKIEEETPFNGGSFTTNTALALGARNMSITMLYNKATRTGKDMYIQSFTPSGTLGLNYFYDDVGDYDKYYVTQYGTFAKQTGDTDKTVEIYYPEDAMKVGFYVGEVSASITPGTTGSSGGQMVIVKDNEVSTVQDKQLIVVGGSCINTVAAKILGSDSPVCGADFSTKTKVSAGGYIIKTVASPYNTAKVAMLVAGYNAEDTQNAVKAAMIIDGVTTDVGSETIYPVTAA